MITSIVFTNKPTPSLEDYLKTIAILKEQAGKVTVTALSESVGVKKPSVSWAIARLSAAGLVLHEKYRDIELTSEGAQVAADIYNRHKALRRFLVDILNVDAKTADIDACRVEHVLSFSSFVRLEKLTDYILGCPRHDHVWSKRFNHYVEHGERNTGRLAVPPGEDKGKQ